MQNARKIRRAPVHYGTAQRSHSKHHKRRDTGPVPLKGSLALKQHSPQQQRVACIHNINMLHTHKKLRISDELNWVSKSVKLIFM